MTLNDTETAFCVTCGEQRPTDRFETGDCTCLDCYDAGRSGNNYSLDSRTGEVVRHDCEKCGELISDHGTMRIDGKTAYICPEGPTDKGDNPVNDDAR